MVSYCPERGDIIWIDFDPQSGKEITKRRPALVLSPKRYNQKTGLCILCPITSKIKGHLFETPVTVEGRKGVVKADQIKSMDWQKRNAAFLGHAASDIVTEVQEKLEPLIF